MLEDLHLAHSTFLDLIEHVADFSRGFPILLVCTARPELRDTVAQTLLIGLGIAAIALVRVLVGSAA